MNMCNKPIVGNIGHFDDVVDMAGHARLDGMVVDVIRPRIDRFPFSGGYGVIVLASWRPLNLGCAGISWPP